MTLSFLSQCGVGDSMAHLRGVCGQFDGICTRYDAEMAK